jgi:hypothetical protein
VTHAKTKKTLIFEQKKLNYFRARKKKGGSSKDAGKTDKGGGDGGKTEKKGEGGPML